MDTKGTHSKPSKLKGAQYARLQTQTSKVATGSGLNIKIPN